MGATIEDDKKHEVLTIEHFIIAALLLFFPLFIDRQERVTKKDMNCGEPTVEK